MENLKGGIFLFWQCWRRWFTSKRNVRKPTTMRMVCWRNIPKRWYSIFLDFWKMCNIIFRQKDYNFLQTRYPNISKLTPNHSAAKIYLLKTIFTSATLMSPELSMNTFHSWISYSRRSFLPAVNLFLIHLIDKQNITKNLYNWLRYSLASTQWTLL